MADLDDEQTREEILRSFELEQNEYWSLLVDPSMKDAFSIFEKLTENDSDYQKLHSQVYFPTENLLELKINVAKLTQLHKSFTRRAVFASRFKKR